MSTDSESLPSQIPEITIDGPSEESVEDEEKTDKFPVYVPPPECQLDDKGYCDCSGCMQLCFDEDSPWASRRSSLGHFELKLFRKVHSIKIL